MFEQRQFLSSAFDYTVSSFKLDDTSLIPLNSPSVGVVMWAAEMKCYLRCVAL